jgi:CDGSH-type Zn-finger protein
MSEPAVTIRCRENGPLVLPMNIKIVDHMGNEFALPQGKEVIALCRCGHSARKPFCDGNHRQANFQACELAIKPSERPDDSSAGQPS